MWNGLLIWFVVSIPAGILVGKAMKWARENQSKRDYNDE